MTDVGESTAKANGITVAPCGLHEGWQYMRPASNGSYVSLKSHRKVVGLRVETGTQPAPEGTNSMHRLHLLGRAWLERDPVAPEGPASRQRPLALLALLAAAGKVGLPRDKALVYLWPESDTQRARNSLHQTLHAIRTDLGLDVIDSGPPLILNPNRVAVDLWEFDAALAAGDLDAAVALHTGPFLDGFVIDDLPDLEEWIEAERLRVTRRYATALEGSARLHAERGDHRHAVHLWRARAQLEPLSAPPTLGLMRALVAAGDRASALSVGIEHVELVRRELGVDPDPTITDVISAIRRPDVTPRTEPGVQARIVSTAGETAPPATPTSGAIVQREPASAPAEPAPQPRRSLRARHALVVVLAAIAAVALWKWRDRPPREVRSPEVIAVFPFTVSGTPEFQYLGNGLVDLLSTSLDGAGSIRRVDPRALLGWLESGQVTTPTPAEAGTIAARFGAGRFVLGSVAGGGTRLRLLASLYQLDRPDSAIATAVSEGDATGLFRMIDDLTSQLLAASLPEPRHRLTRVAATTTSSLPALKSYLTGEDDLRAGRYVQAADAFQRAVGFDSSFALAYYRLAIAADWLGRDSVARWAGEAAVRRAGRLSAHDSLLVNAAVTAQNGAPGYAEQLYRDIVIDYPDDIEAWRQLGTLLFHQNPLRGRSATEARDAFQRVLALDPGDGEALLYLARISWLEGNLAAVDSLAERLFLTTPSSEVLELRAFRAFALSDRDSWKRVSRELLLRPPEVPRVTALQVALFLDDLDGTERFAAILTEPRYSANMRAQGFRLLARTAASRGQWRFASAHLDSAQQHGPVAALELRSLLASLDFLHVPPDELRAIRAEVERWDVAAADANPDPHSTGHVGLHGAIRAYRLGLLSVRLGDVRAATAQADTLDRLASRSRGRQANVSATLGHSLRARAAFAAGRAHEALRHLDEANWLPNESGFEEEAGDRYLRALVLESLGRGGEAQAWWRTIAQRATHEIVYVAPSRLRESLIAAALGDRQGAALAYGTADRLWKNAEAAPRAQVRDVERRLRSLDVPLPARELPDR